MKMMKIKKRNLWKKRPKPLSSLERKMKKVIENMEKGTLYPDLNC